MRDAIQREMLVFVTTIRHPMSSFSYDRIGELLDSTLRSVCRQVDKNFHVFVVNNAPPKVNFESDHISYIEVDFPPPSTTRSARIPFEAAMRDKGTKYTIGIIAARELGANHIMCFDADDYLHRDLAGFANAHTDHPGWFSGTGYIHVAGTRRVQFVESGFEQKNGSTGIVRSDLINVPAHLTVDSSQQLIVDSMGGRYLDKMLGDHGKWQEYLAPMGHIIEPLPFPGAIWEIGTGENRSGNLFSGRQSKPLTQPILDDFGISRPSQLTDVKSRTAIQLRRVRRKFRPESR